MDFALFPVGATNIFPLANSTVGGQLLTEYNLKSRESVATDPEISYFCGPSYKHSESDFQVTASENDPTGTIVISSGRGLVNGHYVELMNDIEISMVELKAKLDAAGQSMYSGDLCVGIRAVYSTETTLAGSMLPEFFETEEQAAQRREDTPHRGCGVEGRGRILLVRGKERRHHQVLRIQDQSLRDRERAHGASRRARGGGRGLRGLRRQPGGAPCLEGAGPQDGGRPARGLHERRGLQLSPALLCQQRHDHALCGHGVGVRGHTRRPCGPGV